MSRCYRFTSEEQLYADVAGRRITIDEAHAILTFRRELLWLKTMVDKSLEQEVQLKDGDESDMRPVRDGDQPT